MAGSRAACCQGHRCPQQSKAWSTRRRLGALCIAGHVGGGPAPTPPILSSCWGWSPQGQLTPLQGAEPSGLLSLQGSGPGPALPPCPGRTHSIFLTQTPEHGGGGSLGDARQGAGGGEQSRSAALLAPPPGQDARSPPPRLPRGSRPCSSQWLAQGPALGQGLSVHPGLCTQVTPRGPARGASSRPPRQAPQSEPPLRMPPHPA